MLRTVALVAAVAVSNTVAANYDQQALVYFNETMGLDVEAILVKMEKEAEAKYGSGRKLSKQRRMWYPNGADHTIDSLVNYRLFQSKGDHGYGCYPYQEGIGATAVGGNRGYISFVNRRWNNIILNGLKGSSMADDINFEAIQQDFNDGVYNLNTAVDLASNVQCGIFHNLFTRFRARGAIPKEAVAGLPAYNSEATLCRGSQRRKHQGALWDSLTVGTFGSQESTERVGLSPGVANVKDCSAWCVYDVRNPNHHFRWNKKKGCYNFNKYKTCKDADSDEEDFAAQVAENVCTEQDNPGFTAHFIAQLTDGSYEPLYYDAGPPM